ncbi:conserved hypothetical protein [Talaromyces stipitatus ATCC 10500]|uniref:Capsule polysaccharide biosynthesis protein n=1 Tax=Talaromyces stipitatus (strain ATCC 10500 / CBS 375.48 / QM 6759 / NRRL 1006) TaxID=441959 RepID=B8MK13_TALSN|nr:uncharacterized protein TSTA_043040 [Talaromyces stipitatus ATCC 10500]EED14830.1 conserved hypothetical protein [Talaromyces stipitatus ATCC 10500]
MSEIQYTMAFLSTLSDLPVLSSLLSWKTLLIAFAVLNRKSLPFAWTYNVFYQILVNLRRSPEKLNWTPQNPPLDLKGRPIHPVFAAASIYSYTSILETDYNIHKSNSTYFADMDHSRSACVTPLYTPGAGIVSKELDEELAAAAVAAGKPAPKKKLPMYIALGATYCSFKREIKPLERYELRSQVVAWDEKWMYIITCFLKKGDKKNGNGEKVLAAIGLSKYCIKKGRLTVPIERVFRASGLLPPRPDGSSSKEPVATTSSSSAIDTPRTLDGLTDTTLDEVKLVQEVSKLGDVAPDVLHKLQQENAASWSREEWTWERIEEQRKKGIEIVNGYIALEDSLHGNWNN